MPKILATYYSYIILLLEILLTLFLGSRMIFAHDFFFLSDQGRDMLLVKGIVISHKFPLIGTHSGLSGFFHGPLWLYAFVPVFLLGHGDPFAFAVAYLFLAISTVIGGFLLVRNIYGTNYALLFSFLLAISPTIWSPIPNTLGANAMPLVYLFLVFFIIRYLRGKIWNFIGVAFFTGIAFQFEIASAIVLVPVICMTFFSQKKGFTNARLVCASIVAFIFSIATFILFDIRHQFLMTRSLLIFFSKHTVERGYLPFPLRIVDHWHSLLGVYTSVFFMPATTLLLIMSAMFVYFIILYKRKMVAQQYTKEFLYLFLFPLIIYIFYLGYAYTVWPEYVFGLTIPVALASTLLMMQIAKTRWGILLMGSFIILSSWFVGLRLSQTYSIPYRQNSTAGSYHNQQVVVDWIFHDAGSQPFGYFVYTPETFTYGMDYLFWFVGNKHGYIPASKKLSITYLIMYPPLDGDSGAFTFWKKNVLHTNGTVILRKIFPGTIIVEKLIIPIDDAVVDPNYYQNLIFR